MTDDRPSPGVARRIFWIVGVAALGCLLFLVIDIRHRMAGYGIVHHGVRGTVTVTRCESDWTGTLCTGDFGSADGRIHDAGVRVNGAEKLLRLGKIKGVHALNPPGALPAAVSGGTAHEAWTLGGSPWMSFTKVQWYTLIPVLTAVLTGWLLFRAAITRRSHRHRGPRLRDRR